jgi:hypothetical protein
MVCDAGACFALLHLCCSVSLVLLISALYFLGTSIALYLIADVRSCSLNSLYDDLAARSPHTYRQIVTVPLSATLTLFVQKKPIMFKDRLDAPHIPSTQPVPLVRFGTFALRSDRPREFPGRQDPYRLTALGQRPAPYQPYCRGLPAGAAQPSSLAFGPTEQIDQEVTAA